MKQTFILFAILFLPFFAFTQGNYTVDSQTGSISSYYGKYSFYKGSTYDYDLERFSSTMDCSFLLTIKFNEDTDEGVLVTYVTNKVAFSILSCYKKNNVITFNLENSQGKKISAHLILKNGDKKVESFWLNNPTNNTAIVFF